MEKYIKAMLIKPGKHPELVVAANELRAFQNLVGGNIEAVGLFDEPATIICNEEGLIGGLPINLLINHCPIFGQVVIVGVCGEEFCSLTDDQIDQYLEWWKAWSIISMDLGEEDGYGMA